MGTCLGFPARVLATCFAFFPPLSFLLYFFLIQFLFRVRFSSELPFFVLHFLVSSSCSFFFSISSMVDYFVVRVDYPSVAFFFANLGCLLESVEEECLERVNFFIREDCPYTFVLLTTSLLLKSQLYCALVQIFFTSAV